MDAAATTENSSYAVIEDVKRLFYGLQFHPEVDHTVDGRKVLANFLKLCRCSGKWSLGDYLEQKKQEMKERKGKGKGGKAKDGNEKAKRWSLYSSLQSFRFLIKWWQWSNQ